MTAAVVDFAADLVARGVALKLTRRQAVARALWHVAAVPAPLPHSPRDAGGRPVMYRLEWPNDGLDPRRDTCAAWAYGDRTPVGDCVALARHALGLPRRVPGFAGSRGDVLNCNAIVDDVEGRRRLFERVAPRDVVASDLLITREHVEVIIRPALTWLVAGEEHGAPLLTVGLSPRFLARFGGGVGVGVGPFDPDAFVVRYRGLLP